MQENDFKYVIQDLTNVYIGARFSYTELMERDDVPFKLRSIFSHYMLKEVAGDTTLADHVFFITPQSQSYLVYKQMKARFRMNVWELADGRKHKKDGYVSKIYTIDDIVNNEELKARMDEIMVEELHITKLGLMAVSI